MRAPQVVQVETKLDTNLLTGQEIVRVRYRPEGTRRWTKLFVVPDADQTVDELLREGHLIARAHMAKGE
jgi:hypothetical protein